MQQPRYGWDACVVIALLTGEDRPEGERSGLLEVVDLIDSGKAAVLTSSLIRAEVLEDASNPDLRQKLEDVFRRPNCVAIDVSPAISERAGQIRSACRAAGRQLKTPDALYIATGLVHGVDEFHTFDDKLLSLSGLPEVEGLVITKPHATQTILPL